MNKQTKTKKKRKINKTNLWAIIISCIAIIGLLGLVVALIVIGGLLSNKPTLNMSDFDQAESSVIYDNKGDEIANLGSVIRQNVEFEEIPNCVVDAFVAIEDSRFFEHNGFDIPRFTKAMLENIRTINPIMAIDDMIIAHRFTLLILRFFFTFVVLFIGLL